MYVFNFDIEILLLLHTRGYGFELVRTYKSGITTALTTANFMDGVNCKLHAHFHRAAENPSEKLLESDLPGWLEKGRYHAKRNKGKQVFTAEIAGFPAFFVQDTLVE